MKKIGSNSSTLMKGQSSSVIIFSQQQAGRKQQLAVLRITLALSVVFFSFVSLYFSHNHISQLYGYTSRTVVEEKKTREENAKQQLLRLAGNDQTHTLGQETLRKVAANRNEIEKQQAEQGSEPTKIQQSNSKAQTVPASHSLVIDKAKATTKDKEDQILETLGKKIKENSATATIIDNPDAKATSTKTQSQNATQPFKRYDNVVIATKIHGPHQWEILEQSFCLLHHAYNHKVLYDIVVFTAEPIPQGSIDNLQKLLGDAKLSVELDNRGFQEEIAALPPNKYHHFLDMCNVTSPANLTWWSECQVRLAYNWQAEFRSLHIWHHPAMQQYRYMVWIDTDGFCAKPWSNDPVEYFIENEGVIMFDHFPQAQTNMKIQPHLYRGFNRTICEVKLNEEGTLVSKLGGEGDCHHRGVPNIHGFFHITDMDFYRSKPVKEGLERLFGDCFLCRVPDDQLAVTAPAAILAPERSWEMRSKGFHLDVFHNGMMDGLDAAKPAGFIKYWAEVGKYNLPSADGVCPIVAKN